MSTPDARPKATAAFVTQAAIGFGVSAAATTHGRIDQARMEKLLAEHDPFTSVA